MLDGVYRVRVRVARPVTLASRFEWQSGDISWKWQNDEAPRYRVSKSLGRSNAELRPS